MSGLTLRDRATGKASMLTPTERLVALCLAYRMRDKDECFPSLADIARWTGLGIASVKRSLDTLCGKQGLLRKVDRPGRYSSKAYLNTEQAHYEQAQAELAHPEKAHGERKVAHRERKVAHPDNGMRTGNESRESVLSRVREGRAIHDAVCPACEKAGGLTQSPGRNGHPPGFWCRRPPGCGTNFPLDFAEILDQLTPGARRSIEATITKAKADRLGSKPSKADATDAAIDEALRRIDERGVFLVKSGGRPNETR